MNMKKILVSGSLAYDYIYKFAGNFQDELIADGTTGHLSVAFNVVDKAVNFGGCAGNIAFNGKLLKKDFIMVGIAGLDFEQYEKWLKKHSIDTSRVIIENKLYTAQATVVNDKKGQQITFFHEGAAGASYDYRDELSHHIRAAAHDTQFAIISPNNRDFILTSVAACQENMIPYFFDPGQAMPVFSAEELTAITEKATGLFMNEYELELFQRAIGLKLPEILKLCPLLILTLGERGSRIYFNNKEIYVPAIKSKNPRDPTGCGDAYRAGFLAEIQNNFSNLDIPALESAAKKGTQLAAACLQIVGTQNHHF